MFKTVLNIFIICSCIFHSHGLFSANIGFLVVATGNYSTFVKPLIKSAKQHFCKNHKVTYYIFTDRHIESEENMKCFFHPHLGWPYDTLMRFQAYNAYSDEFLDQDYLFASDADMLFIDSVGDEILEERVATLHPGFVDIRGSYEDNPKSCAFVSINEGEYYFASKFIGGSRNEFLQIIQKNLKNIYVDLNNDIVAVWFDESHWNRYCIDNPPTLILDPSYCYPESWNIPYPRKFLCLDKNHNFIREYKTSDQNDRQEGT